MMDVPYRFIATDASGDVLSDAASWTATATPAAGTAQTGTLGQDGSITFSLTDTGSPWTIAVAKGATTLNYPPLVVTAEGQVVPALLPASALTGTTLPSNVTASSLTSFGNPAYGTEPQVNLLVNGGFEIWQRGTGPFTATNAYFADRWVVFTLGTSDTLSISKDTTHQDSASAACAAAIYTKSGGGSQVAQKLEDYAQLQGKTVSASVRVKTSTAFATRVFLYDGTTATYSGYHSGGGTFETLTATQAMGAASSTMFVGVEFDQSCTAYIDNAMLVVGPAPINYIPLTPADEWARCQRYYEIRGPNSAADVVVQGWASGASQTAYAFLSCVRKAVTPTVTKVGTWGVSNAAQPGVGGADVDGALLSTTSSASGEFHANNSAAGTYISFEANP